MQSDAHLKGASAEARRRKHESRNPPVGRILLGAGLVLLIIAICLLSSRFMMGALARRRPLDEAIAARGVITAPDLRLLLRFPSPHLQVTSAEDLAAFRAREDAEMNSYGWVDPTNGIVRIPLARAMDLIAERGLPARGSNAPARTGKSSLELIQERKR